MTTESPRPPEPHRSGRRFDDSSGAIRRVIAKQKSSNTEQRKFLIEQVFNRHEHFDADQLMEQLPSKGAANYVSRPTVYRTLREFVDAGLLNRFDLDGRSVYEHDYGYPHTTTSIATSAANSLSLQALRFCKSGCGCETPPLSGTRTSLHHRGHLRRMCQITLQRSPPRSRLSLSRTR